MRRRNEPEFEVVDPERDGFKYCNACGFETKFVRWFGKMVCPYHQRVEQTSEGPVFMYDEFDQDGGSL